MNGADYAVMSIVCLMALRVGFKGFIAEFSSKSGVLIGVSSAVLFSPSFSLFLDSRFTLGVYTQAVALAALFIAGFVAARYLLSTLQQIFALLHLEFFDHVLGIGLGAAEGAFLAIAVAYLLQFQTAIDTNALFAGSVLIPRLYPFFPAVISAVKGALHE